jgi:Flp pilus assembly protein TadG
MLVFGMVDFGYAINRYAMLNNAAREGVRAASLSQDAAAITTVTKNALQSDVRSGATVVVACKKANATDCTAGAWDTQHETGGLAIVTVSYSHTWITPVGRLFGSTLAISKTSQMRIE